MTGGNKLIIITGYLLFNCSSRLFFFTNYQLLELVVDAISILVMSNLQAGTLEDCV